MPTVFSDPPFLIVDVSSDARANLIPGLSYNDEAVTFTQSKDITLKSGEYLGLLDGQIFNGNGFRIMIGDNGTGSSAGAFSGNVWTNADGRPRLVEINNVSVYSVVIADANDEYKAAGFMMGESTNFNLNNVRHYGPVLGENIGGIVGRDSTNFTVFGSGQIGPIIGKGSVAFYAGDTVAIDQNTGSRVFSQNTFQGSLREGTAVYSNTINNPITFKDSNVNAILEHSTASIDYLSLTVGANFSASNNKVTAATNF
jgi:hypothetical protein